jgi:2'-hydroxyisoflavone reductase
LTPGVDSVPGVRILVLGGTGFVGRHLVAAALDRGHDVATFARGLTDAGLPTDVEQLHGDRDSNLTMLAAGEWDLVVDCDSYEPDIERTRAAAELLESRTERYAYLSSVRAYASFEEPPAEDAPRLNDGESDYYGARKGACEAVVEDVYGERALLIRPGVIVGPGDPRDRYTWWCCRLAGAGATVAPAPPERPMQLVDVRDLGAWLVRLAEDGATGAFNVAGPRSTLGSVLETTRAALGGSTELVWVDEAFLTEHGVGEWYELPLWLPDPAFRNLPNVPIERAVAAGLTFRPLEDTARSTLDWARRERGDRPWEAGLSPEREAQLLAAAR